MSGPPLAGPAGLGVGVAGPVLILPTRYSIVYCPLTVVLVDSALTIRVRAGDMGSREAM